MHDLKRAALLWLTIAAIPAQSSRANAQGWDFDFSWYDVYQTNALDYVVEQTNIRRVNEGGGTTYWCPNANGTEARLTQKFTFPRPTARVFLGARIDTWDFGGGSRGFGSLWGSKDGTNWVRLIDAPVPPFNATYRYGTFVNPSPEEWGAARVPASLEGSKELWLQTRLQTSGMSILAQFQRGGPNFKASTFALKVNYQPTTVIETAAIRLRWFAESNRSYKVQWRPALSTISSNWTDLASILGAGNETNFMDWTEGPVRIYRVFAP